MKSFKSLRVLLLMSSVVFSSQAMSEEQTLAQTYKELQDSYFGGEFEFKCGNSIFKLTKSPLQSGKLYWKSGLDWSELENVSLKAAGVSFEGLGIDGGISKSELPKGFLAAAANEIPLFNLKKDKVLAYLDLKENSNFVSYKYEVDFYSETLNAKNMHPFSDYVVLNKDKYIKDESRVVKGHVFRDEYDTDIEIAEMELRQLKASSSLNRKQSYEYDVRQVEIALAQVNRLKTEEAIEHNQQERNKFIRKVADEFGIIEIETPSDSYSIKTRYCYAIK